MKYIIIAIVILFLVQRFLPAKGVRQISTAQLKSELKDKHKQYIDVRTPGEFIANHIREFKNIPLHELGGRASELAKDKEIIVICQSGMRSNRACKLLKKQGYQVANVKGGMSAW